MTNLELWNTLALAMTSVVAVALFYIWTAIALAAVFRKSGEEGWKAWVPILNGVVFLRIAGFSGWLVLVFLIPVAGLVLLAVAAHRINVAFGRGAGMTVLAVLLFPVWATILGFGPDRWLGREGSASGPLRSSAQDFASFDEVFGTSGVRDEPSPYGLSASQAPAAGWTPPPLPSRSAQDAASEAPPVPPRPPLPVVDDVPGPMRSQETAPDYPESAPAEHTGDVPMPPVRRTPGPAGPEWELPEEASDPSWDFDFGPSSATSEVTDAVPGAPAPVAAAPAQAPTDLPPAAPAVPPVTRVPSAPAPDALREPWAPAPSPMPGEGEAFPESSGPVSAIAGAPDAGVPRSARSSVSAMHTRPHIPEEEEIEATVVARRKRTAWTLTGPDGAQIPLTSETVIVGRRPAADPEHPDAQLVSLDDDTRTVSKTHALLELRDDKWYITDLDSTNGVLFTTLMGTEVAATPGDRTEAGDRFLLGDAEVSLARSDV